MFELLVYIVIIVAIWFGSALFLGLKWATATVIAAIAIVIIKGIGESEKRKDTIKTLKSSNLNNPLFKINYDRLDGHSFESYCADLLLANDYADIEITPASGDKGVDLIVVKDGKKYGIQCKRYSGAVGIKAVQEALSGGIYYQCDKAVVMTNSSFTQAAIDMANRVSVELWDRSYIEILLRNLLKNNQVANEKGSNNNNEKDESKQGNKSLSKDAKQLLVAVIAASLIFAACILIDNTSDPRDDMYYNDYDEEYEYEYDYDEMD